MQSRKEELKKELKAIQDKEMAEKLKDLNHLEGSVESTLKLKDAQSHRNIMYGDFFIKFAMALFVSLAFIHIVYTGNVDAMTEGQKLIGAKTVGNGNFQLLSVVGPLFGMILQYYFGTKKKSANGE